MKNDFAGTIYIKLISTQNPSKPVSSGTAAAQLMEETSHVSLKTMQGINEMQILYSQSFLTIWWALSLSPVFWFLSSGTLVYFTLIHYYISYMTTKAILKSNRISSPVKSLRWSCSSRVAFWGTPEKIIFTIYIFEQNGKFMQQLKWNNLFLPQFVHSLSQAELIRNWETLRPIWYWNSWLSHFWQLQTLKKY